MSILLTGALAISTLGVNGFKSEAAEVGEYNYAKLLQESLYFYDANMCGKDVGERSAFSWRDDCHTTDSVVIDGETIDVSGGFHDAGDHGKFGITQGYSATILGISYLEFKEAFEETGSSSHLQTITNHFCEYFEKCTVLNSDGTVKCFIYQVGDGTDHNYWGAPENQSGSRPVFYSSADNPATDEISEAISALTLQYINFGDSTALDYAEKLFTYVKGNNKAVAVDGLWDNNTGSYLYDSSSWGDDYALAAALLYKATNDQNYINEFNSVRNASLGNYNIYWFAWDKVAVLADYYGANNSQSLLNCANSMKKTEDGYNFVDAWGSARYNCNISMLGLMYDKANGANAYTDWSKKQIDYILGNNSNNQCYVVGYNSNSSKYPHHRAASASSDANQISNNRYTLLGALVGGPKDANGTYTDNQGDYQCNEVALDYNAGLVGAAAGLYLAYKNDSNVPKSLMSSSDISDVGLRFTYTEVPAECSHVWDSGVVTTDSTCTAEGVKTYTCTKCNATKTEKINKKNHTEVIDPRVEATTTSTGLTEGSHCSVCNMVIRKQEVIPMKENTSVNNENNNQNNNENNSPNINESNNNNQNNNSASNLNNSGESNTGKANNNQKVNTGNNATNSSNSNATNSADSNSKTNSKTNKPKYSNEWMDGRWYDSTGKQTYEYAGSWKGNSSGWWYEDESGWYPTSQWLKIDGKWYYFHSDGYLATSEWIDGYYLGSDGAQDYEFLGTWKTDGSGWWFEDESGWYPSSQWQKINGSWYYFESDGYIATNKYVDGYWLGASGAL